MKTFNVRLFAILVASIAVFGVGIYFLHAFQVRRNAHVFLEEADKCRDAARNARREQDNEAVHEWRVKECNKLREYCSKRPEDIETAVRLGNLYAELGQSPQAMAALEKVLRQVQASGEERGDVRRRLVEVTVGWGAALAGRRDLDAKLRSANSTPLFTAAQDHLQNYLLKDNPDDGELWDLLGQCQEGLNQNADAAQTWEKAIGLAPQQVETYRRLGWLLAGAKKRDEADRWIRKLVEANPDSYRARLIAGDFLMTRGALDEAIEHAVKAVELVEPALAQAERAVREDPDDFDLQREYQRAVISRQQALLVAARCLMEKAARTADEGRHAEAAERFAEARKFARQAVKLYPSQPDPYEMLADTEFRASRLEDIVQSGGVTREGQLRALKKARDILRDGVQAVGDKSKQDLMWRMANMLIDAGQTEEAVQLAGELRTGEYTTPLLAYLEGRIAMSQANWQKAIEELDRARSGLAGTALQPKQIDYFLGQCYGQLGNPDQEREAYRRALAADPNYAQAKEALDIAMLNRREVDNPMEIYRGFRKRGGAPAGVALALAQSMIYRNLRLSLEQRRWTEVEDLLAEARKAAPDSARVALIESEMLVARGRPKEAEELLRQIRDKAPKDLSLRLQLAALAQRRNEVDEAEKILDEAKRDLGDSVELCLARASCIVQRYPADEAAPRLRELEKEAKFPSVGEKVRLWNGLHINAIQANDLEQARRLCEKVADSQPNNVQARFRSFELAQAAQDEAGMKKALDEVKKIEGAGPMWSFGEALRLRAAVPANRPKDPRLDEALALLAAAGKSRPSWANVPRMMAVIHDQQGKPAEALRLFQQAVKLGDRSEAVYVRTAQLLMQQNRHTEAEALIQDYETRQGILPENLRQLQAQLQVQRGDVESAIEAARKAAESSEDYRTHLSLGRVLFAGIRQEAAKGDLAAANKMIPEATKAFQKATELADRNPDTWLPLVQFLCATGQTDKAKEAVAEVLKKLPAQELRTPLTLAQCYEALGDVAAAQEKYETLLGAAPDSPAVIRDVAEFYWRTGRPQQAEAQLQRILGGRIKVEPGDLHWARRVRAAILFGQGGYHNQERARKLIEQNLAEEPTSTPDQRLKASILASLPDRTRQEEALAILERLASSPETRTNDDRYNLGLFYLARNEWGKFNDVMRRLLAGAGDEPRYLVTYIIAVLQRNELQNAETWLDHLQKVAPNQFNTTGLRAELLARRGKYEEALETLKEFVDRPAAQPADAGARRLLVAEALERLMPLLAGEEKQLWQMRYLRQAENLLRQYVGERPGQESLIIDYLGRQGNVGEALTLLERIWPKMNPVAISKVVLPLLSPGRPTKEQLQRGERLLKEALERFDRPVPLLMAQADLWTLHERYEEAEALYREILAKNSSNPPPVAINNLAVILALQGVKLDEALKLVNRAIEIAGPDGAMLDSRASVYIALKQPDKALADVENALAQAERPERLFHLAQAQRLKGNDAAAADAIRRANQLGLTSAALHPLERASYKELQKLLE